MNQPPKISPSEQASGAALQEDSNRSTEASAQPDAGAARKPQTGKMMLDLLLCIVIPTIILKKLSAPESLGSDLAMIVALGFPVTVALHEFISKKKIGFVPALGFINILLTGGIGLLGLPSKYFAIKEALIPGILAIAVVLSTYTRNPLIRVFLYNDMVLDTRKIANKLDIAGKQRDFDNVMVNATWLMASSLILSSVLNFILAKWIVVSPSGSPEFNSQVGTMNLMSYPVIVLPCMIITIYSLFYVIRNIRKLTGLSFEQMVHQ